MEELEAREVEYEMAEEFLSSLKKKFGGGEEVSSLQMVDLDFLYFIFHFLFFSFHFMFLSFYFQNIGLGLGYKTQRTKQKGLEQMISYYMLTSCSIHGHLGQGHRPLVVV